MDVFSPFFSFFVADLGKMSPGLLVLRKQDATFLKSLSDSCHAICRSISMPIGMVWAGNLTIVSL